MYSYLFIILVIIFGEMNGINIISSNFPTNYEIYIAEILEIINKQKEKLDPIMVRIGYNLIYCVSLCQIRYNRIKNVVSPKINILRSSIINYLKDSGFMIETTMIETKRMLILIDNNGNEIRKLVTQNINDKYLLEISNKQLLLEISNKDQNYYSIILLDKNSDIGCINHIFYQNFPESFEYEVSEINFMAIELEHNDKTYVINLKPDGHNYYIVNNSLNQKFFKYYIKNVLKSPINEDNFDYKVTIIDHNVNIITLLPNQHIILDKHTYQVFPILSENNTNTTQNIINDTVSTNSDSDKSDDFIKVDSN